MNVIEAGIRAKLRFQTPRGLVTIEDLFDLPLQSTTVSLDDIAKKVHRELLAAQEESFVTVNAANTKLELSMDVLKHIIAIKLQAKEDAKKAAESKARKSLLTEVLAEKEVDDLKKMSTKEIKKELKGL